MLRVFSFLLILSSLTLLSACDRSPIPTNEAPTAQIEVSREDDALFAFDARASSDPDGTIVGYNWDFGDGETGSGETVTHQYKLSGDEAETFDVVLTVTDDDGATGTASTIVTGEPPGPAALRGLVEVTIQGDGGATFVPVDGGQGVGLEPLNSGFFDTAGVSYDDCDNSRGTRFLFASYRVRNGAADGTPYDVARRNITFLAVDNNGANLGVNALGELRKFDGSAFADPATIADCIKPTHRVRFDPIDGVTTVDSSADMQAFAQRCELRNQVHVE
ncbi:MAG: PKD domain-containing protein, partial [Trueperaceae bacterium]|nr:PKD domain-containing protein [Trueperaceae bacterium]